MKKRLLALLLTAVAILAMAVSVFAEPNLTPDYSRYLSDYIFNTYGSAQDISNSSIYGTYEQITCPYCGYNAYRSWVMVYENGSNDALFERVINGSGGDGGIYIFGNYVNSEPQYTNLSIIQNTYYWGNCVANRGLNRYANVDVMSFDVNGISYSFIVTHAETYVGVYPFNVFGATFYYDTNVGQTLIDCIYDVMSSPINGDIANTLSLYAFRMNTISMLEEYVMGSIKDGYTSGYDDGYMQGEYDGNQEGYSRGFIAGRLVGQDDANVLNNFDNFFEGFFDGVGGFFEPFFNIGIGSLTIGNMLGLFICVVITMLILKVGRG